MPTIIESVNSQTQPEAVTDEQIDSLLFANEDELTIAGRVIEGFIQSVDYGPLMDDEDAVEFLERHLVAAAHVQEGEALDIDEVLALIDEHGTDVGETIADNDLVVETLDGEYAEAFVDLDDLKGMFEDYVDMVLHEQANGGDLDAKALYITALEILDDSEVGEDELDEAKNGLAQGKKLTGPGGWKRGAFRKMRAKGDKMLVNRMLGAMLRKQAITRTKKGQGYRPSKSKQKGDYGPTPEAPPTVWPKYPTGSAAGKSKSKQIQKKASSKMKKARAQKTSKTLKQTAQANKAKDTALKLAAKIKAKKSGKKPGGKKESTHDAPANVTESGYPRSYGGVTESDAVPGTLATNRGDLIASKAIKTLTPAKREG